ncbi:hypothetical protein Pla110_33020 [Polystyrenella longa]|uniref:Phage head-tail joining protein n=1 Tax=Polystyrenella longa TaxID=2528007 RepID=A0A518CQS6_9PLAN|nr:hypothetical protein [Polystyrenella longa]QDU81560.1 hypothetical protein Pla110_33020 [Polystyrenella longa]
MSLQTLMKDSVKVYLNSYALDETTGFPDETATLVDNSFPCHLQPASEKMLTSYGQRELDADMVLFHTDQNLTFTSNHEIETNNTRYDVVSVKDTVNLNKLFVIFLRRQID